jgi:hypothetical protein
MSNSCVGVFGILRGNGLHHCNVETDQDACHITPPMPVIRQHLSEDADDHCCKLIPRLPKDSWLVRAQVLHLMVHKEFVPWPAVQRKPDPVLNRLLRFSGPGREGLSLQEYIGSWEIFAIMPTTTW